MAADDEIIDGVWLREQFATVAGARKAELAKRLGIDPSQISRMVTAKGKPREITTFEASIIRTYFREIAGGDPGRRRPEASSAQLRRSEPLPRIEVRKTLPGSSPGAFRLEPTVVGRVSRPDPLEDAREAYAFRVVDATMEPEHRQGSTRLVDPNRHPRLGDTVVLRGRQSARQPVQEFLAHLVKQDQKKTVLQLLNPPRTLEFDASLVESLHKVVTQDEMLGG